MTRHDDEGSFITIVTGLPRSGTSMMMQVLQAGGMPVATDGLRAADESNPKGYFELEAVKRLRSHDSRHWLGGLRGKAVKIIFMLLYDLPHGLPYKLIVMRRDLGEVLMSQRAMLARGGKSVGGDDGQLAAAYGRELARLEAWLASREDLPRLTVDYAHFLAEPRVEVERITEFLGRDMDAARMVAAADATLYRCRRPAVTN